MIVAGVLGAALALAGNYFTENRQKIAAQRDVRQAKIQVLLKIAGNRAGGAKGPVLEAKASFIQGLNETMIAFSDSAEVVNALVRFKEVAMRSDKRLFNDRFMNSSRQCVETSV